MKIPQKPPRFDELLAGRVANMERLSFVLTQAKARPFDLDYLHWDKLRHLKAPDDMSLEEWWLVTKFQRLGLLKPVPLQDKRGQAFQFCAPELVQEQLHRIDVGAGASIGIPEPITNPQT